MKGFWLEVWGDYACFTRPEMKVERVSYDVITPSAARAIFDAILWKPAIRWNIREIHLLNTIRWISVRRNEVAHVIPENGGKGICIDELKNDGRPKFRQQRAGLLLRDVRYRIHGEFDYIRQEDRPKVNNPVPEFLQNDPEDHEIERKDESPGKYCAMFERRARKGQCFHRPYLGCREFSCDFKLVDDPAKETAQPINESPDLGWMLYDLDFSDPQNIRPLFYRPQMQKGIIKVPDRTDAEEVRG